MGYTHYEIELIGHYAKPGMSVLDCGSQNDYTTGDPNKPPFVSEWYKSIGITDYTCIDLAGDNNALRIDMTKKREWPRDYDLVIDAGFGEHLVMADEYESIPFHEGHINSVYPVEGKITDKLLGFYNFWVNKFALCKIGGKIISINPETNSWPFHCYHWITKQFYTELADMAQVRIDFLGRNAGSNNYKDGWNVVAVLEKTGMGFPNFDMFKELPIFDK